MPLTSYGPNNPLSLSQLKVELAWEGKYDKNGRHSCFPTYAPCVFLDNISKATAIDVIAVLG